MVWFVNGVAVSGITTRITATIAAITHLAQVLARSPRTAAVRGLLAKTWARWVIAAIVAVILVVIPLTATPFTNQTITRVAVFSVAVLGLNLLLGYTGQVSLGHIFFVGVGAYCAIIPI